MRQKSWVQWKYKKAIDQYQKALFYIGDDDVDDTLQSNLINQVKDRLDAHVRGAP